MRWPVLCALLAAAPAFGASYDEFNAGIQSRNNEQWAEAITHFDAALSAGDLVPGLQFVAHLDRGQAQLNLGHADPAIADFTASLALRPGDAVALSERSAAYASEGKIDEALSDIEAVIHTHPFDSGLLLRRAGLNARRGAYDKALDDIKAVRDQMPDNAGLYRTEGLIAWQAGELAEADSDFSSAVSRGPDPGYSWLWYALIEIRLGKTLPKRAVPDFDSKAWPGPILDFFLGSQTADAVFAAAAKGDADAVRGQTCEANFYLGEWLLQHQDAAGARPLIHKAAEDCPRNFVEWGPAQQEAQNLP